jgi:hypothetical protein
MQNLSKLLERDPRRAPVRKVGPFPVCVWVRAS